MTPRPRTPGGGGDGVDAPARPRTPGAGGASARSVSQLQDSTMQAVNLGRPGQPGTLPAPGRRSPSDGGRPGPGSPEGPPGGIRSNVDDPYQSALPGDGRSVTGDPIDVTTGEVVMTQVDLDLPGVLALALTRTHVSSYRVGRWFGLSWASTLDQRLEVDERGACYASPDGMLLLYPAPGDDPVFPSAGPRLPLTANMAGYAITDPARGRTLHFTQPGPEVQAGTRMWPLTAVSDRNGNRIELDYDDAGTLTAVRHSGGYQLGVETARGRITALRLVGADLDGPLVRYAYDDLGRLAEVSNSAGEPMSFEYDAAGRLIGWQDRIGGWYRYDYGSDGRCVRTTGADGVLECRLSYDPRERTTTVTDSLGNRSQYVYNERRQVVRRVDPLGHTTDTEWDPYGRLLSRTDPLGRTTRNTYDADGNLTGIMRPDGTTIRAVYNGMGQPVSVTDPDGVVRRFEYDERGNLTATTDRAGATTRYGYNWRGHLVTVADPTGARYDVANDGAGLPVAITDPTGAATRYERDAFGRPVTVVDPVAGVSRLGWTAAGKLAWRTAPDGATERWRYDHEGHLVEHIDQVGGVTRYEIGQFGRPAARVDPDGARLAFEYDTELRLVAVTNPQGLVWRYQYDPAGRLTFETDFNGHAVSYDYDPAGQLTARTHATGERIQYTHDLAGNIVAQRADQAVTTFEFDPIGQLRAARASGVELTFVRDAAGRITAETCNGATVTSGYDPAGRRTYRRTPSGAEAAWEFDPRGLAATLRTGGHTLRFGYDPAGREIDRRLDERIGLAQSWDPNHRLLAQTLMVGSAGAAPEVRQRRVWEHRADGHLLGVDDQLSGPRRFDLDPAGRVTAVHGAGWTERYAYDAAGNLTSAAWPAASQPDPLDIDVQGDREYAGTLIRRAGKVRYEHDQRGRVVLRQQKRLSGKPLTWHYTWDAEDRLTAVTTPDGARWLYQYDPVGRRTAKWRLRADGTVAEVIRFVWDGTVLAEQVHQRAELPEHDQVTVWEWAPDSPRPLTQTDRTMLRDAPQEVVDQRFFAIVTDLVNAPAELVTPDGEIAWHHRPTLWGRSPGPPAGDVDCPLRFPGQYYDPETGSHYNYRRYYDPATGRYQSPDPLGLAPGPNPQSYVANPNRWIDPLGLQSCAVGYTDSSGYTWAPPRADTSILGPGEAWHPSQGTPVLGRLPDTSSVDTWPGHARLNLPPGRWSPEMNDAWIQSIIDQRGTVYVGSPTQHNYWDPVRRTPTVFAREVQQLLSAGYRWEGDHMIPPP